MSGTIRIITKKPDATEISGYVASELSGTSEGGTNYNFNGAINLPIIEDKLAMRATDGKLIIVVLLMRQEFLLVPLKI